MSEVLFPHYFLVNGPLMEGGFSGELSIEDFKAFC